MQTKAIETVIRDLRDAYGTTIIRDAVIKRTIIEEVIGIQGIATPSPNSIIPLPRFRHASNPNPYYHPLNPANNCPHIIYILDALPLNAHFKLDTMPDQTTPTMHITTDVTLPTSHVLASHKDYKFVLIVPINTHDAISPKLYIYNIPRNSYHPTCLPNTWDNGNICLAEAADTQPINLSTYAPWLSWWANCAYNNHLRPNDTPTMQHFWLWEFPSMIWTPNHNFIPPPTQLPEPYDCLLPPLISSLL